MKSPAPEALRAKSIFQIQPTISGVHFSNNTSIPHIYGTTFETFLTIKLNDKSLNNSIQWSWLYL